MKYSELMDKIRSICSNDEIFDVLFYALSDYCGERGIKEDDEIHEKSYCIIKGTLNTEQQKVYNIVKDFVHGDVLVEPLVGDTIMLSGSVIYSTNIEDMIKNGLMVYYIQIGKLAVYRRNKFG